MAFTREQLMSEIWGTDYCGESRTVDMHIRTLRGKLGPYGDRIETVRGVGYRLEGKPGPERSFDPSCWRQPWRCWPALPP